MKKHILYLVLIFCANPTLQAQKVFYNKIVKTDYSLYPITTSPTAGGGVLVCGIRSNQFNGSQGKIDGFVMIYDKNGTLLQSKAFSDANQYGVINGKELRNGNYLFSYQNTKN